MIVDATASLVAAFLGAVFGLIPTWTPPDVTLGGFQGYLNVVNGIIPVGDLWAMLLLALGFGLAMLLVRFVVWLYRLIPLKFT